MTALRVRPRSRAGARSLRAEAAAGTAPAPIPRRPRRHLARVRRTGAEATAAAGAQQNTRDLSGDLAAAQQKRIAWEAGYNQAALGATAVPISANQSLYGTSSNAADSLLGDETQAAKTPSFWDEVGNSVAGNLGKVGKL